MENFIGEFNIFNKDNNNKSMKNIFEKEKKIKDLKNNNINKISNIRHLNIHGITLVRSSQSVPNLSEINLSKKEKDFSNIRVIKQELGVIANLNIFKFNLN